MPNVIAFPGVTLQPNLEGLNQFKPSEITLVACCHLAWCITEKTNPAYGQIKAGLSDEGDGWLYCNYLMRRSCDWTDTSPLVHFEKTSQGVRGKFFLAKAPDIGTANYHADCLQELIIKRQPKHAYTVTKVLFERHAPKADQITAEIEKYPERIVTIDGTLGQALRSIDYSFIEEVNNLVNKVATQNIVNEVGGNFG